MIKEVIREVEKVVYIEKDTQSVNVVTVKKEVPIVSTDVQEVKIVNNVIQREEVVKKVIE